MADTTTGQKKGFFAKLRDSIRGVVSELKKVSWPTKVETKKYTIVVLGVCAAFALLFWLIDTGILALLELVIN